MAFLSLLFNLGSPQTMIGSVPLDALLTEDTELTANVTGYAVEDGPPVTDHITQEPERLALSGVVTAAGVLLLGAGGRSKLIQAKEALRQIHRDRLPVTIVTGMAEAQAAQLLQINADFGAAAQALTAGYPEAERLTWPIQQAEALAWAADNAAPTPYLDGLADARGISHADMRTLTLAQVQEFQLGSQQLVGTRQRLRDEINAATTVADVRAVVWPV